MAIYDYDGTNNHEIGKVYDYDGSANHQIGKVYDYDGSSNHLVYSADYTIISNSGSYDYNGGWSGLSSVYLNREGSWGSLSSSGLYNMKCVGSYGNHNGAVNVVSNQKIDLSQGKTLTVTYKIHDSSAWGPPPWFKIFLTNDKTSYTFDGGNSAHLTGTEIFYDGLSNGGSGTLNVQKSRAIDVSNYNGTYYISFYAQAGCDYLNGRTAIWDVYSLILS